ncbi:MAG: SAM-dependent methyltransferase [Ruminococcaceae bacterium]|jgi:23S rRNA (cytosine1962-C5)-methyltransferase|nr:SAM-dependent methyltransferase [Oscillospiraceae bacterium]
MRVADSWVDYVLIDCSDGDRLESWGKYTMVRPDPQVIWKTEKNNKLWFNADAVYHRSKTGGGHWEFNSRLPESWQLKYKDLIFNVKNMGFKHMGIFPEQAVNWDYTRALIEKSDRQLKVLNLFAYTGGATVSALKAGASVVHVDASKGMVQWAKENAASSGVADRPVRWIVDDCVKFVQREIRRGNKYDIIIMDPPSYGRGPNGEVWKVENEVYPLVELCSQVLSDDPVMFLINSYTTGLSPAVMEYILGSTVKRKFGGHVSSDEIGLRARESGLVLPCGSSAIWEK